MTVVQQGQVNTTSLTVPDVVVQIVPPQQNYVNGIATNILGLVGTATWGPVNAPTIIGDIKSYVAQFGAIMPRKYDMGTAAWVAILNGASNLRCVRVTDGTDTAATATIGTTGLTVTSKYTGSLGNGIAAILAPGTASASWRLTITLPGLVPEVFDNVAVGLTGNAVWQALATAVNNGISGLRGPSQIVVASAGASTAAPVAATAALAGGSDGASAVGATQLIGIDGTARSGMYALRATGTAIAMLADCDAASSWPGQVAYGLSEGTYMVMVTPAGDTITSAVAAKASAGIDSYAGKLLFGDWVYFNDTVNAQTRLISPQGFVAGLLSALSPAQSALNKPLAGIVATQKSNANAVYSTADLQALATGGLDIIANPCPGGSYYGERIGRNCSSNQVINGDNYPRLTNYIAYTLNAAMGLYIGRLQSPSLRNQALGTINAFLSAMWQQGMIGDVSNPTRQPFSVQLDAANNPPARVALGYMQVDVRVTYLSVVTVLLINVEGGQSVSVTVAGSTATN
ncbi:MAG: hypothetical protein KGK11_07745 [Sphingomonadales bacterium]|nr:hypothetical protein [Sphingomonadales bacterium]